MWYSTQIFTRSSHQGGPIKEAVLKIFAIFTGKHLHERLFLIKKDCNLLQRRCFPVKFAEFLRTPILNKNTKRLLLSVKCFALIQHLESYIIYDTLKYFCFKYVLFVFLKTFRGNSLKREM